MHNSIKQAVVMRRQKMEPPSLFDLYEVDTAKQLACILERNEPSLTHLDMSSVQNAEDVITICEAVRHNKVVRIIKIQLPEKHNIETVSAISSLIAKNTALRFLDLSSSALSDNDMLLITTGLMKNVSLLSIDLRNNNLALASAQCIALFLAKNNRLTHIDLSNNSMGLRGAYLLDRVIANKKNISSANYWCRSQEVYALLRKRTTRAHDLMEKWHFLIANPKPVPPIYETIMYSVCASQIAYQLYKADMNLALDFENYVDNLSKALDSAIVKSQEAIENGSSSVNFMELVELARVDASGHSMAKL